MSSTNRVITPNAPRPSQAGGPGRPAPTGGPATYATWLEDAGIPARVIDELMGHQASSRGGHLRGSAIGAHHRHTTPEMAARVIDAIQQRLTVVLGVAELVVERHPNPSTLRAFDAGMLCSFPTSR
jgi:hypothetical protein